MPFSFVWPNPATFPYYIHMAFEAIVNIVYGSRIRQCIGWALILFGASFALSLFSHSANLVFTLWLIVTVILVVLFIWDMFYENWDTYEKDLGQIETREGNVAEHYWHGSDNQGCAQQTRPGQNRQAPQAGTGEGTE